MKQRRGPFASRDYAEGYAEGMEYVNDSAIDEVEVRQFRDGYWVLFEDADQDEPFPYRMMPGQESYTRDELKQLRSLVFDAAKGDPGEQGEIDDRSPR